MVHRCRSRRDDGPIQVESFAKPVRCCGVWSDPEAGRLQVRVGRRQCGARPGGRGWNNGNGPTVRPEEASFSVIPQLDPESLFVHGAVVTSARQNEVVAPRRAAVSPVAHVVRVAVVRVAAGEAAAAVPGSERPPDGGRNRARLAPDVEQCSVSGVGHDYPGGIARETARRFRRNCARRSLEKGEAM